MYMRMSATTFLDSWHDNSISWSPLGLGCRNDDSYLLVVDQCFRYDPDDNVVLPIVSVIM